MLPEAAVELHGLDVRHRLLALVDGDLQRDRLHPLADRLHLDQLEAVVGGGDPVVAAKHLDRHRLDLRLLGRLAPDVPDGDDRDDDLLRHGPAVDEPSAADEVEPVRPLGNPELHVAIGPGRHAQSCRARPPRGREVGAEQVAFLGEDRAVRLLVQLALVRLATGRFGEQEAVVGRDDDVVAVQVVDDVADQRRQFVDGRAARPRRSCPSVLPSSPTASTVLW